MKISRIILTILFTSSSIVLADWTAINDSAFPIEVVIDGVGCIGSFPHGWNLAPYQVGDKKDVSSACCVSTTKVYLITTNPDQSQTKTEVFSDNQTGNAAACGNKTYTFRPNDPNNPVTGGWRRAG